ncbi:(2Fe-2S)-binding protein (plasmid) [Paraburkholderia terrae]|uniref:(2Fe-2S)-binding protein n=1 Tax=Paraburkholderia terrae TaxID=311230 RepID=A0ABN6JX46_9BURK|nr:Rieske 2Fe-2S domain-containing protein [Paraburkholderia terrae]BCZ85405.1 (2Fe-2S)-binding protein [Paraburkholderia terrae]
MTVANDNRQAGLLCALAEVPDGGAIEISALPEMPIVIVRRGVDAWAYRNVCPHFSIPLNYEPNTFWTYDGELLMCAHHSAMFRFEDGRCVEGPCEGTALTAVGIRIDRGEVFIDNPEQGL